MSGVNPIVLIQMLMQYHNYKDEGNRTFKFVKNNRMKVHYETNDERAHRKSVLSPAVRSMVESSIYTKLRKTLQNRIHSVWIDTAMDKIAVPLQMSTGHNGYGTMTVGSRMDIPEGRFVRAFTYWEKVNDIDLSCFALTEDGEQREFSWRNMYSNQGTDICFSGDETGGFNGGSEYFDIDIDLFKANHPKFRYLVFCDNIYSDGGYTHFNSCTATAGFMIREKMEPGTRGYSRSRYMSGSLEPKPSIFDPKTVKSSFRLTSDSSFCYMFAIDLERRQMIWLDISREGNFAVAGTTKMNWLLDYLTVTDVYSLYDLFMDASYESVSNPDHADVVVTDNPMITGDNVIRSWDTEKIFEYLKAG